MEIIKFNDNTYYGVLSLAERTLLSGGLVVSPTDTVYGILGNATDEGVIKKIFALKKRPEEKALPIFVKDIASARKLAYIADAKTKLLEKIWPAPLEINLVKDRTETQVSAISNGSNHPSAAAAASKGRGGSLTGPGPITVIFHHKEKLPPVLTGGSSTVGIRIPDHPFLLQLLGKLPFPFVQTSANIAGKSPAQSLEELKGYFSGREVEPDLIIDGGVIKNQPSVVIDFTRDKPLVLRTGVLSPVELDQLLNYMR